MQHHKRFWEIKEDIPGDLKGDRELLSVAYIMASNKELENKMAPYIDWINGFDYEKMFEEEKFSPSEKILAQVAVSLYDNGVDLQFNDVFSMLDPTEKELALNAANYRYDKKGIYESEGENFYIK